ncbi:tripartite tricarboxylate transporter TctB family protein [Lacibacterium aquatile]|uniref:Tripartite tricarboxylate transporter TctB family protein n=1 Tax=Lacibacterium aquatile TaxID=1168082 RepID=A0ABW5DSZ5_9PROT
MSQAHGNDTAPDWGGVGLGVGIVVLALLCLTQVIGVTATSTYDYIGPRNVPMVLIVLLGLGGGLIAFTGWRGQLRNEEDFEVEIRKKTAWDSLVLVSVGMVGMALTIVPAGFIPAASFCFVLTARAFGSRRILADIIAALVLTIVTFFAFTQLLGLVLPAGPLEGIL